MGYGTRNNGQIKTYWPDDTEKEIYITSDGCTTLEKIHCMAVNKWGPAVNWGDIRVEGRKIQTDCLAYDFYDPSDWTDFIVIINTSIK
jgi:hypothetical protein